MQPCIPGDGQLQLPTNSLFALPVHIAFALPIKLSLSQPVSFLTFTLLILSPIPRSKGRVGGDDEQAAVWCLVASWG